jgi:hypothetical protein
LAAKIKAQLGGNPSVASDPVSRSNRFLDGARDEAAAVVPDALIDEIAPIGGPTASATAYSLAGHRPQEPARLGRAGRRRRRGDAGYCGGGAVADQVNFELNCGERQRYHLPNNVFRAVQDSLARR